MDISPKDILIRVVRTPNPQAVKLTANFPFKKGEPASFTSKEEARGIPLPAQLFAIPGVLQLYVMENQITISHDGRWELGPLSKTAENIVRKLGPDHNPEFARPSKAKKPKKAKGPLSENRKKAEEILDRCIRPGLQADGGDLKIVSFKGNKVSLIGFGTDHTSELS